MKMQSKRESYPEVTDMQSKRESDPEVVLGFIVCHMQDKYSIPFRSSLFFWTPEYTAIATILPSQLKEDRGRMSEIKGK